MKIFIFECRKQFFKKSIIVAILLFSVLNIVKIHSIYDTSSLLSKSTDPTWKYLYWEMYEDFRGTITNEKIEKLMSIYQPLNEQTADMTASTAMDNPNTYTGNLYNDTYFFQWNFVNPMEYAYMYRNYANNVVTTAKKNKDFFESIENEYEYRKNAAIVEMYKGRIIPSFSYVEMYKNLIHYDFSTILVILICIYALVNVFIFEKETEMDLLLLTTKAGGSKTVLAKIMASVIFVCFVSSWFWLIDFAAFAIIFESLEGTFSPIYSIENFVNSSIDVNLGEFVILSNLLKTVGILVLALVVLFVTTLFKNTLAPFIISLILTFGSIYIQEMNMGSSRILLKVLNPYTLIVNRELFRNTEFVNLFGYPVISYILALIFSFTWVGFCLFGILLIIKKNIVYSKGMK
ncbi:ABC transporter permease [Lysinibacillus sp. NPDC093190]|uniref:ABC transporter permease n=1 Tax=Lysinibacillus sp. NPDC093190 TaxID=3390575 RepID=UPI003D00CE95